MHRSTMRFPIHRRFFLWPGLLLPSVLCLGCGQPAPLTVDMPLHLEDHLDAATIVGSEVPDDIPEPVEWRFDEPQPDWRPATPTGGLWEPVKPVRTDDALRLPLSAANRDPQGRHLDWTIYTELPDLRLEDWAYVEIRARTSDRMESIRLGFNYTEEDPFDMGVPFYSATPWYARAFLVTDGTIHSLEFGLTVSY